MSRKAISFLEKSGWYNGREVDIEIYNEALKNDGYKVNHTVEEFLKQFGGIEIAIPAFRRPDAQDKIYIDPRRAINVIYKGNVEEYEERVGEPMTVIGLTENEQLVLMISETGIIYAAFDYYLTVLGNDIYEAIENMSESKETPEV